MDPETWGLVWLIVGALFLAGEVVIPGFILLPFGVSALVAAIVSFSGANPGIGWLIFIIGGVVGLVVLWKYARKSLDGIPMPAGVGADRLLGMSGTLVSPVPGGATGRGMVRLGSEEWRAEALDGRPIAAGVEVEVVEVKGTVVQVRTSGAFRGEI